MILDKNQFENIEAEKDTEKKVVIYPKKNQALYLNFYKTNVDFAKEKERTMFIKRTVDIIRLSDEYWGYIAHLKNDIPEQNHCAFHDMIFDSEGIKIEMHHGPVFTLYDIVEITLLYFLKNNKKISSFRIFDQVVRDHHEHLINTVPLCKTCHLVAHNNKPGLKKPFIHIAQSFGNFVAFVTKYADSLTYQHINKIRFYLHQEKYYEEHPEAKEDTVLKESIKSFK